MLRAVLLGVLLLSVTGCKSHDETSKSQPGVAAGKVIEASGTVTVHHGDAARPLAKGETVEGDDVVETGADGSVVIELAHNNATWELGPNKKTRVRESLAWNEAKKDRSAKAVEQDSAAAGRHAERNAADTTASAGAPASAAPEPEAAADTAPPAAETVRADKDVRPEPKKAERKRDESAKKTAPPPPPPAPPTMQPQAAPPPPAPPAKDASAAPKVASPAPKISTRSLPPAAPGGGGATADVGDDFGAGLGTSGKSPGGAGTAESAALDASSLVRGKTGDLKACLAGSAVKLTIKVDAAGRATVVFADKVDAKVETCMKKVVHTITFPKEQANVTFVIKP